LAKVVLGKSNVKEHFFICVWHDVLACCKGLNRVMHWAPQIISENFWVKYGLMFSIFLSLYSFSSKDYIPPVLSQNIFFFFLNFSNFLLFFYYHLKVLSDFLPRLWLKLKLSHSFISSHSEPLQNLHLQSF